jgi:hypothetical protein
MKDVRNTSAYSRNGKLNNVGRTIIGRSDLKSLCKQCFPLVPFCCIDTGGFVS